MVIAACAPSQARVDDAMGAQYRIRRDALWGEIVAAIRGQYPKMQIAELDATRLVTGWTETSHRVHTDLVAAGSQQKGLISIPVLVQVTVVVTGTNPFQIAVEMEAAIYRLAGAPPTVFRRDRAGWSEVYWLPTSRAKLTLAIHDRLKAYENAH